MSRIISIIKDRHLGDFEYNRGRKTVWSGGSGRAKTNDTDDTPHFIRMTPPV